MVWPFKRRDAGDEGPAEPTPADAAPATEAPSAAPSDPGWRALGPMPSAVPVLTPMVQRKTMVDALTSWRSPDLSLAPLGHALESDGPSGRVATMTAEPLHPVSDVPSSAGPEAGHAAAPPLSYVQRAPITPTTNVRRWTPPATPTLAAAPIAPAPAPGPSFVSAPPPSLPTLQLEALPAPTSSMPPQDTSPEGAMSSPDAPLVGEAEPLAPTAQAPQDDPGAAAVQRAPLDLPLVPVQRHEDHGGGAAAAEEEAAPSLQRAPLDAPTAPLVGDDPIAPQQAAPAPTDAAATPSSAAGGAATPALPLNAPVQRSTVGRPVGLGRPISHAPIEPRPAPAPDALPVVPGQVQRAPLGAEPEPAEEPVAPLLGSTAIRPSLQRSAAEDAEDAGDDAQGAPGDLPLAQRAAEGVDPAAAPTATEPLAAAPLVGATPLVDPGVVAVPSSPSVQRAPDAAPDLPLATTDPAAGAAHTPNLAVSTGAPSGAHADSGLAVAPLVGDDSLASTAAGSSVGAEAAADPGTGSSAPDLPLAAPTAQRAGIEPTAPLEIAPLLGGRPFAVASVQRAPSTPTPSASSATSATTGTTPADVSAASALKLSPAPGVYDPVLPIAVWNGAGSPALPAGNGPDAPPSDIVATVQRSTGVDLSNVRIRRDTGPAVQRMAAKALTHEGEVHLPEERGPLHTTENRSLVAHELVHVAQQRTLGSSRPLESTPGGQHLELQAQHMEHATATGAPAPDLHLHTPAPIVQRATVHEAPAPAASPFTSDQLSTLMALASNPPSPSTTTVQRELVADDASPASPIDASPAPGVPPAEQDLDELADKLFPRFRRRWTRDLRSDRERHGNLTDLHR